MDDDPLLRHNPSRWTVADLRRPPTLLGFAAAFLGTAFVAQVVGCNVHEVGHAAVGSLVGWEVEQVRMCLPAGGGVEYGAIPRWAGNVQGYAGGLTAAIVLGAFYSRAIRRYDRPLRSPGWWAAGLAIALFIGPQLVLAVVEGAAGPGEDYTRRFADEPGVYVTAIIASALAGAAAHAWRWRWPWRVGANPRA